MQSSPRTRERDRARSCSALNRLSGLMVALFVLSLLVACSGDDGDEQEDSGARDNGVMVELAHAEVRDVSVEVRGIGTLQAVEQVTLRPELASRVQAIHFTEGGRVEAGQLLVELDAERAEQTLAARQAALRALVPELQDALRTLERQRELRARDLTSQGDLDRAETEHARLLAERERLQAELAQAVRDVADSRILAPFDGLISEPEVDRGSFVSVGEALATLYRTDEMDIRFSIPERYLAQLQPGQQVRLQASGGNETELEGELIYVGPAVDVSTRSITVRARLPNEQGMLRPGVFATAFVVLETRSDQVTIPDDALVATRHGYIVYVVDDEQRARRQEVSVGVRQQDWVQITEGLDGGERIVWRGHMRVDDGTRVVTEDGEGS